MNKAFVRETDGGSDRCPSCGSQGIAVGPATIDSHVPPEQRADLAESGWFCPGPNCPVAYFDVFERTCPADRLARPVYPKDPTAPLCGCFGFTCEEIDADLRENTVARTRALIDRARSPEARCATEAASGQSCIAEVQRYYMRHKSPPGEPSS